MATLRACVEALGEAHNSFSIITRGPLIVRDVDVLAEAARRADVSVTFSVPTLDDTVWKRTEPSTAHPRQRLRALKTLVDAGIRASVGMAPILPGLSDKPELLEQVVREAREAGACGVWANLLYLRPGTREHFLTWLHGYDEGLHARYLNAFRGRTEMPREYDAWVREVIADAQRRERAS